MICLPSRCETWSHWLVCVRESVWRDKDTWMSAQSALLEPSLWDGFFFNSYITVTRESVTTSPRQRVQEQHLQHDCVSTFLMRSRASMVRYGGKLSLHFKILSMVFFLFSAVKGGWKTSTGRFWSVARKDKRTARNVEPPYSYCMVFFSVMKLWLTDPVIISYMRAPRLHQSTALLWPSLVRISGALVVENKGHNGHTKWKSSSFLSGMCATLEWGWRNTHMYSMVPQKVCVTEPSWIDSLQRPKSVSLMCPTERLKRWFNVSFTPSKSSLMLKLYYPKKVGRTMHEHD